MSKAQDQFITGIRVNQDRIESPDAFPFCLPAVQQIESLNLNQPVTFIAGENGSGKSTIIESLAVLAGFGSAGGSKGHQVAAEADDLQLSDVLSLKRSTRREKDGYFLRAESFYGVAQGIPKDYLHHYGGDLVKISHGESFMALVANRFGMISKQSLFFLDEPESALSPSRQLELLIRMRELASTGAQFIVATHSPILMAYPDSKIYWLSRNGIEQKEWKDTEHYAVTKRMLSDRDNFLKLLGW